MNIQLKQPKRHPAVLASLLAGPFLLAPPAAHSQQAKSPPGWTTPVGTYDEMVNPGLKELKLLIEVQTDKDGKVGRVAIYKGSGIMALDNRVAAFAMMHWKGPPNSKLRVPVTFAKRPKRTGSYL